MRDPLRARRRQLRRRKSAPGDFGDVLPARGHRHHHPRQRRHRERLDRAHRRDHDRDHDPAKEATVWGKAADPDYDKKNNWYEFVFGGDPLDATDQGYAVQPLVSDTGRGPVFGFTYPRRTNDPSLTYTPAESDDLQTWHSGPGYLVETGTAPLAPDFERVSVEDAGTYALYSGLLFLAVVAIILAPVAHRVLHRFHFESDSTNDDSRENGA